VLSNSNIVTLQLTDTIPVYLIAGSLSVQLVSDALKYVRTRLGKWLDKDFVNGIIIGDSKETVYNVMKIRDLDSMYVDGQIFVLASEVNSSQELINIIVHEVAHAIYRQHPEIAEGFKGEYLLKRKNLMFKLMQNGVDTTYFELENPLTYNLEFDNMLLGLGYKTINRWMSGDVIDSYGLNSLEEYFASNFEHYFMGEKERIKELSPKFLMSLKYL
jgi:hypothetical protein